MGPAEIPAGCVQKAPRHQVIAAGKKTLVKQIERAAVGNKARPVCPLPGGGDVRRTDMCGVIGVDDGQGNARDGTAAVLIGDRHIHRGAPRAIDHIAAGENKPRAKKGPRVNRSLRYGYISTHIIHNFFRSLFLIFFCIDIIPKTKS